MMYESDHCEDGAFRFRLYVREELPEGHQKSRLEKGLDPFATRLIWSFYDLEMAEVQMKREEENAEWYQTYYIVDVEAE